MSYNKDLILSKSDPQSNNFDTLYFVSRETEKLDIPSFIKKINSYAISECDKLLNVTIP